MLVMAGVDNLDANKMPTISIKTSETIVPNKSFSNRLPKCKPSSQFVFICTFVAHFPSDSFFPCFLKLLKLESKKVSSRLAKEQPSLSLSLSLSLSVVAKQCNENLLSLRIKTNESISPLSLSYQMGEKKKKNL